MRSLTIASVLLIAVPLYGCISTSDPNAPMSAVRLSPMGPGQYMITCVDSPMYCANLANKTCPQGFDVKSNVTNPADYGRMTMIIKCN
jgi:hypothetical protein